MKIYIKTDMTEMPKGCTDCNGVGDGHRVMSVCKYNNKTLARYSLSDIPTTRPDWCPLVEHFVDANKMVGE